MKKNQIPENPVVSEFDARVRMYRDQMSRTEQQIAQYIMRHEDSVHSMSIQALAEAAGTGVASVVRLCRTLGYEGFADMKYQIRQGKLLIGKKDVGVSPEDDANAIKQKVLHFAQDALERCIMKADSALLEEISTDIAKAARVFLIGSGTAETLAQYGAAVFLSQGIFAFSLSDPILELRGAAFLQPGDLLIALCYSGYTKDVGDTMRYAKESGAKVLLITSRRNSLLGKYADYELYTIVRDPSNAVNVSTTSICQLALLQTILAIVQKKRPEEAAARSSRILRQSSVTSYDSRQTAIYWHSVHQES